MTYDPQPIDTASVELPEALLPLIERLAENNHDNWAAQRIEDGWRYGADRDDQQKTHPCLVPYSELPEDEKVYDRVTVKQALKAILSLGWRIEPPGPRR